MTPNASPSSLPMRFCPPSPRVSERYAASACWRVREPGDERVSSSSGCAAMSRTRALTPRPSTSSPSAAAPRSCAERGAAAESEERQRREQPHRSTRPLACRGVRAGARLASAAVGGASTSRDDARLLLRVRRVVAFGRARALGAPDVADRNRVPRRRAQPRRHERPRAHVLRLLLRPHDFLDAAVAVDRRGRSPRAATGTAPPRARPRRASPERPRARALARS